MNYKKLTEILKVESISDAIQKFERANAVELGAFVLYFLHGDAARLEADLNGLSAVREALGGQSSEEICPPADDDIDAQFRAGLVRMAVLMDRPASLDWLVDQGMDLSSDRFMKYEFEGANPLFGAVIERSMSVLAWGFEREGGRFFRAPCAGHRTVFSTTIDFNEHDHLLPLTLWMIDKDSSLLDEGITEGTHDGPVRRDLLTHAEAMSADTNTTPQVLRSLVTARAAQLALDDLLIPNAASLQGRSP